MFAGIRAPIGLEKCWGTEGTAHASFAKSIQQSMLCPSDPYLHYDSCGFLPSKTIQNANLENFKSHVRQLSEILQKSQMLLASCGTYFEHLWVILIQTKSPNNVWYILICKLLQANLSNILRSQWSWLRSNHPDEETSINQLIIYLLPKLLSHNKADGSHCSTSAMFIPGTAISFQHP